MSSSAGGGMVSTLSGGIQNMAALLPLLGTKQCEVQVTSALTRGYLYAAATPMSIFGSLGMVRAGLKTLVACFSFGNIEGAKMLGNMGSEPQGENLSLIMVETGEGKNKGRYIVETRMDELIKEFNIDKNRIIGISHKSAAWNVKMMATTALLCAFSIAPYAYVNWGTNGLNEAMMWVSPPAVRATGGFITTTLIQLLIQRRIIALSESYLVKLKKIGDQPPHNTDIEAAVERDAVKKHQMDVCTWLLLSLLLLGLLASVVGCIGCFSVVRNSTSEISPVTWVCWEAGLSIIRFAIWAWNPKRDDPAPPLEIILELDEYEPLPTCNKDNEEILKYKVLPLTRARKFLKTITSFVGLVDRRFSYPDLTLYYTLTRKRCPEKKMVSADAVEEPKLNVEEKEHGRGVGERVLYITVFDHKEHTTRIYTRDNEADIFYSTNSDAPLVDVGHLQLEVELGGKFDPKFDPVFSDRDILDSLRKHHQSILEHIQYRVGAADVSKAENSWTMKVEDTISALQKLKEERNRDNCWIMKGERSGAKRSVYCHMP